MNRMSFTTTASFDTPKDRLSWGVVEFQVTDLARAVAFWTANLGFIKRGISGKGVALGTKKTTLFVLYPGAIRPVAKPHTGIYHVAIGVPNQAEFSRIFARLLHLNIPVGPTDHLMAKSLYLMDPDGIEIEFTLETPERFSHFGDMTRELVLYDVDGNTHNGRGPLNVDAELAYAANADLKADLNGAYLAHLHFKVAEIESALVWFEKIGFQRHLTLNTWGFADMGAGKPNTHRLAMNTWAGQNQPPAPSDMARLVRYELIDHTADQSDPVQQLIDPSGSQVILRPASY